LIPVQDVAVSVPSYTVLLVDDDDFN